MYNVKYQQDEVFYLSGYVVVLELCNSEKFYLEDEC